ncbi:MAG: tRNA pseudouridine(55) synthase TruB [Myxococcota bacterium]|nr:tRNA pseudouridine(55) synthase TruB [Myxococcota bacterium]
MHGLLIVDKPAGITSTDVLRQLGRFLRGHKLGHGGTLDPFATGLLPVLVGHATRLLPFLHLGEKTYRGRVRLGVATSTLDRDGEIVRTAPVPEEWSMARVIAEVLPRLQGEIQQRVPAFAAVRVQGERLHARARRGEEVERPVRTVQIHELVLESWDPPELTLRVRCGSGTYVRSLAEQLGELLGTVAHLRELRRLAVGAFTVEQAVLLDGLTPAEVRRRLIPPAEALPHLPAVFLDQAAEQDVRCGRPLGAAWLPAAAKAGAALRLLAADGQLLAIGEVQPEQQGLRVLRGFPTEVPLTDAWPGPRPESG